MDKPKRNSKRPTTGKKETFKRKPSKSKPYAPKKTDAPKKPVVKRDPNDESMRLNRFISNAGICSRREADTIILSGAVSINDKVVTEMGVRVQPSDKVTVGGETIQHEKKLYLVMNKPKNFVTSANDALGRKTALQLVGKHKQAVSAVDKMDRASTGVLMFTNDLDLAKRLTRVTSIYQVTTDKNVSQGDLNVLVEGFELEGGFSKADEASFVGKGDDRKVIGIEIRSNKNKIVKRMMEHLGYKVMKLDRVSFANLTKKDLARGQWRYLTNEEVAFLKMTKKA
ncbi:MAG: rRNA pseudouridine synthase [Flavobacteriales bacterium]|nr:rRNA pseudouridine synthase [Flavobacteriales bacterium]MCB9365263.1 rRNA pseudouridine synthase [Flavobacteriales bacterium]